MLKNIFILALLQVLTIPNFVLAHGQDKIRESTILFKMDKDVTPSELKKFNALVNPGSIIESKEIEGLAVYVVKIRNIKGFEKAFSEQLINTGAVEFAEPDASIAPTLTPNDPYYGNQWHHSVINSPTAWDHLTGPNNLDAVKVCVLDTGVDTDHDDLIGNLLPGHVVPSSASSVEDLFGHGTGTAGVIGAVGNNNTGVSGMAWNIDIIPVKISMDIDSDNNPSSSAWISDMAIGIRWCADQGAKVANLSYGGAQYSTIDSAAQYLRNSGGLLFMSAGNSGTYNSIESYPDYSSFVIVGATSSSDVITSFSETGPFVDIAAPGQSIRTTYKDNQYVYYSGTSFSSPMTAGLAALIYSVNPQFTPIEVENYIFNTAADLGIIGDDDTYGHGRIDAGAALASAWDYAIPNIAPTSLASASVTSGNASLLVDFFGSTSSDSDGSISSYIWNFGDDSSADGMDVSHTYTEEGTYNATLTVTDNRSAQTTSNPITITVTPDPNQLNDPSGLTATVNFTNTTLTWEHNLNNLDHFEIHRAKKARGKYVYSAIGTGTILEYIDSSLELGTYRYKVRAIGLTDITTDFSNPVSVIIDTTSTEPDPGTLPSPSLTASLDGLDVTLSWTHDCPTDNGCTYSIERGDTKSKGNINFSEFVDGLGLSYTFPENSSGTYYYKVYAIDAMDINNFSDDSNIVNVRLR